MTAHLRFPACREPHNHVANLQFWVEISTRASKSPTYTIADVVPLATKQTLANDSMLSQGELARPARRPATPSAGSGSLARHSRDGETRRPR